ncbi:MAG: chorismate synthase [Lentihominibacter sp.]
MSVAFGRNIKVDIYGASHADRIGVKIDGLPAGLPVDMQRLQDFLDRRAPGKNAWSTPRREADAPEVVSGIKGGLTDGNTLEAVIYNRNTRPADYGNVITVPRPGHADYTAWVKNGRIETGGGKWSGRMTAPLCIAGGICMQFMESKGIKISAHIYEIGGICDEAILDGDSGLIGGLRQIGTDFPTVSEKAGELMKERIASARAEGDSVGGQIECVVSGMPPGIGDALFGGMESRISQAVFAVPAVKGIEFGRTEIFGSVNNDGFCIREGRVETVTNNHGGILGGISSGMPLVFRVRIKPTPSIGIEQDSVDLVKMEPAKLEVRGRHDPCIVPRAVPCIEAAAAIAVYDMLLGD